MYCLILLYNILLPVHQISFPKRIFPSWPIFSHSSYPTQSFNKIIFLLEIRVPNSTSTVFVDYSSHFSSILCKFKQSNHSQRLQHSKMMLYAMLQAGDNGRILCRVLLQLLRMYSQKSVQPDLQKHRFSSNTVFFDSQYFIDSKLGQHVLKY